MNRTLLACLFAPLLLLAACGEQGRELVVGTYKNEETVVFSETSVQDEADINRFIEIVEASPAIEVEIEGLPDYVVTINNPAESTMELMVNIWEDEAGTMQFTRGIAGEDVFEMNPTDAEEVRDLLQLEE
ncbi:hypothetical protein [Exiguobacterium aurantiacum]|uniref:Lipoprotein n=1 Tax=Exiguobacterium aurantiacum TaxID=33987 RepID=A0A377FWP6_9BACL|nr:hypothetical protein [Exiguobacterium aurantiacum]STO09237.1 Uncharacterised protein [Exiguobacterium aurantiacum]